MTKKGKVISTLKKNILLIDIFNIELLIFLLVSALIETYFYGKYYYLANILIYDTKKIKILCSIGLCYLKQSHTKLLYKRYKIYFSL